MCSKCFCIHDENRDHKNFKCKACGYEADADYNASINIKNRAFDKKINAIVEKYEFNQYKRHEAIKKYFMKKHKAVVLQG